MDAIIEAGLSWTHWLQTSYPDLAGIMAFISSLGDVEFYLALGLFIYWCVHKTKAKHLAYLLALGFVLVNILKFTIQGPRPFWFDPSLLIGEAIGYGVPSGHVTSVSIAFIYIASWSRRRWIWITSSAWIGLMAVSRIYLGHHFPLDVFAGFTLAGLLLLSMIIVRRYWLVGFRERILGQRFWMSILLPVILASVAGLIYYFRPLVNVSPELLPEQAAAEIESMEEIISSLALLLGVGIGFVLEGRDVRFLTDDAWWRRGMRYLIGAPLTLAVLIGLNVIILRFLPEDTDLWLLLAFRFIRYLLVSLIGTYYLPMAFAYVGLVDVEPEPEIKASLNRLLPDKKKD